MSNFLDFSLLVTPCLVVTIVDLVFLVLRYGCHHRSKWLNQLLVLCSALHMIYVIGLGLVIRILRTENFLDKVVFHDFLQYSRGFTAAALIVFIFFTFPLFSVGKVPRILVIVFLFTEIVSSARSLVLRWEPLTARTRYLLKGSHMSYSMNGLRLLLLLGVDSNVYQFHSSDIHSRVCVGAMVFLIVMHMYYGSAGYVEARGRIPMVLVFVTITLYVIFFAWVVIIEVLSCGAESHE